MLYWNKHSSVSYCITNVRAAHTSHWVHVWGATNYTARIIDQASLSSLKTVSVAWPVFVGTCNFAQASSLHLTLKERASMPLKDRLSSLSDLVSSCEDVPCSWLLWWCLSCCALPVALGLQALRGPRGSETYSSFRDTSSCSREVTTVTAALTASNYAVENTLSLGPFSVFLSWKCGISLYAAITYNGNSTSSCMFSPFLWWSWAGVVIFK